MRLSSRYDRDRDLYKIHTNTKQIGYEYHKNILKNVLSSELFSNPTQDYFYRQIERTIEGLIDSVKNIKHHFSYAIDREDIDQID